MGASMEREKIRFVSGDTECAAWHYPGTNGGCVVMAGGFAVTKEPGTDLFARRFHEAGFSVLAFDYRHLGESGGQPRQVQRVGEQLADWRAAIGCARALPGVDPARIAIWSFSASAATCSGSPRATQAWPRRSPRRRTPTGRRRRATRRGTRSRPPCFASPAGHRRRRRRPGRPSAEAGAARRAAGNRRDAHHAGWPGWQQGARSGRQVPGLAAGGRRPFGPSP